VAGERDRETGPFKMRACYRTKASASTLLQGNEGTRDVWGGKKKGGTPQKKNSASDQGKGERKKKNKQCFFTSAAAEKSQKGNNVK